MTIRGTLLVNEQVMGGNYTPAHVTAGIAAGAKFQDGNLMRNMFSIQVEYIDYLNTLAQGLNIYNPGRDTHYFLIHPGLRGRYGIELEFCATQSRYNMGSRVNSCMQKQNGGWWRKNWDTMASMNGQAPGDRGITPRGRLARTNFDQWSSHYIDVADHHGSKSWKGWPGIVCGRPAGCADGNRLNSTSRVGSSGFRIEGDSSVDVPDTISQIKMRTGTAGNRLMGAVIYGGQTTHGDNPKNRRQEASLRLEKLGIIRRRGGGKINIADDNGYNADSVEYADVNPLPGTRKLRVGAHPVRVVWNPVHQHNVTWKHIFSGNRILRAAADMRPCPTPVPNAGGGTTAVPWTTTSYLPHHNTGDSWWKRRNVNIGIVYTGFMETAGGQRPIPRSALDNFAGTGAGGGNSIAGQGGDGRGAGLYWAPIYRQCEMVSAPLNNDFIYYPNRSVPYESNIVDHDREECNAAQNRGAKMTQSTDVAPGQFNAQQTAFHYPEKTLVPFGILSLDNILSHLKSHGIGIICPAGGAGFHLHISEFPMLDRTAATGDSPARRRMVVAFIKLFWLFEPLIFSFQPDYRATSKWCQTIQSVLTFAEIRNGTTNQIYNYMVGGVDFTVHGTNVAVRGRMRRINGQNQRYLALNCTNCTAGGIGTLEFRGGFTTFDSGALQAYINFFQNLLYFAKFMVEKGANSVSAGHNSFYYIHSLMNLFATDKLIPEYCYQSTAQYNHPPNQQFNAIYKPPNVNVWTNEGNPRRGFMRAQRNRNRRTYIILTQASWFATLTGARDLMGYLIDNQTANYNTGIVPSWNVAADLVAPPDPPTWLSFVGNLNPEKFELPFLNTQMEGTAGFGWKGSYSYNGRPDNLWIPLMAQGSQTTPTNTTFKNLIREILHGFSIGMGENANWNLINKWSPYLMFIDYFPKQDPLKTTLYDSCLTCHMIATDDGTPLGTAGGQPQCTDHFPQDPRIAFSTNPRHGYPAVRIRNSNDTNRNVFSELRRGVWGTWVRGQAGEPGRPPRLGLHGMPVAGISPRHIRARRTGNTNDLATNESISTGRADAGNYRKVFNAYRASGAGAEGNGLYSWNKGNLNTTLAAGAYETERPTNATGTFSGAFLTRMGKSQTELLRNKTGQWMTLADGARRYWPATVNNFRNHGNRRVVPSPNPVVANVHGGGGARYRRRRKKVTKRKKRKKCKRCRKTKRHRRKKRKTRKRRRRRKTRRKRKQRGGGLAPIGSVDGDKNPKKDPFPVFLPE